MYDSILSERKKKIHEDIGRAIEEIYPTRLEEFYEVLAHHYLKGDRLTKAYDYLKLSSEKSIALYAYSEAVRSLEQALEIQEAIAPDDRGMRCDLLIDLCNALLPAGDPLAINGDDVGIGF